MMKNLEYRVGLFTLLGLFVIGYIFFALSPESFSGRGHNTYYTLLPDAGGVVVKTHVKANGVVVGKVKDLYLQGNQTRIVIEVGADLKLPKTSRIAIKEKGLLGDVFIDLIRGSDKGEFFQDGDMIPPSGDHMGIAAMMALAGVIGQDLKTITQSLAKVFGGEEGSVRLKGILDNFYEISENLKNIVGDNGSDLKSVIANVKKLTENLATVSDAVGGANSNKIAKIVDSIDSSLESLKRITGKIQRGEGTIGRLVSDDTVITNIEDTLKEVRNLVSPASKLELDVDYHGELRADASTQHYFNLWFKTREDRAYLLGFTQAPYEIEKQIENLDPLDVSPDSQSSYKRREIIVERQGIRFNAQYAKRWAMFQARFGLFETTGGVAADFFFFRDKLKLTFEGFDWGNRPYIRKVGHFKTYATLVFMDHLYLLGGVDDFTRIKYGTNAFEKINYFMGAGFRFTDNDLKAMFGAVSLAK